MCGSGGQPAAGNSLLLVCWPLSSASVAVCDCMRDVIVTTVVGARAGCYQSFPWWVAVYTATIRCTHVYTLMDNSSTF